MIGRGPGTTNLADGNDGPRWSSLVLVGVWVLVLTSYPCFALQPTTSSPGLRGTANKVILFSERLD